MKKVVKELKAGDVIELNAKQREVIRGICERIQNAKVLADLGSQRYREEQENLWKAIWQIFPEIKRFKCGTDGKNVRIERRLSEYERVIE